MIFKLNVSKLTAKIPVKIKTRYVFKLNGLILTWISVISIKCFQTFQWMETKLVSKLNFKTQFRSKILVSMFNSIVVLHGFTYCSRSIITCSWLITTLIINHEFLAQKLKNFLFLVHKLSVVLIALQYKPQWKMG